MALINVYSRSPISHKFTLPEKTGEKEYVIYGTNTFGIVVEDTMVPKTTEMDEDIFKAIKERYKDHVKLFGGKTPDGVTHEALIYIAKSTSEAAKIMKDAKPVITEAEMATKTKNIQKVA